MNDTINSIIRLDLCPLNNNNQGNDFYEPLYRQLGEVKEIFTPSYNIIFNAPKLSGKVKYYRRLIDNTIKSELNELLCIEKKNDLIAYKRKKLNDNINSFLIEIKGIISSNNFDLDTLLRIRDYSENLPLNECTYIYHYLILSLIRCYMEFQQHFIDIIEPDKQRSVSDFFVQTLQWKIPEDVDVVPNIIISNPSEIEIIPSYTEIETDIILSFKYKLLQSESNNINTLFSELKKHRAIPTETSITDFKHLFSGVKVANPITWIGNKSDLAYLFKLLVNQYHLLEMPQGVTIWDIVDANFIDIDGYHFGKDVLRKQQKPRKTAKDIEHFAYLLS